MGSSYDQLTKKETIQALFTVGFAQNAATTQKRTVGILQPHMGWQWRKSGEDKIPQ